MKPAGFFMVCIFCVLTIGHAQVNITDSIHQLQGFEIKSKRFSEKISGVKIEKIDSIYVKTLENSSLSTLLSKTTSLSIKSYGVSGLSSVSVRGAGTSHTAVVWNGLNLQNVMNGSVDFNLIPSNFLSNIQINYNGMSTLYGSGAIGGSILLKNNPEYNQGFAVNIGLGAGSFFSYLANINLSYSNKNASLSVKSYYKQSRNNFRFTDLTSMGQPEKKQENAREKHNGILFDYYQLVDKKNVLSYNIWYHKSDREIPPVMFQQFADAFQKDEGLKMSSEWKNSGEKHVFYFRSGMVTDRYHYNEKSKNIFADNKSISWITEAETELKVFKNHLLMIGLHYDLSKGLTDNYTHSVNQQEIAFFSSYLIKNKNGKWNIQLGMRQGYDLRSLLPFLPSIGADFKITKSLSMFVNANRNYRKPTLNDLYWHPGGNINLKPEKGFSEELGVKQNFSMKNTSLYYTMSFFNNNISDWIIWLPSANYWTPQNIQSVWNRGIDLSLGVDFRMKTHLLKISSKSTYVKSTVQKSTNAQALNKQMIYTPEITSNFTIFYHVKFFGCMFSMDYYSKRYASPDHDLYLKGYTIGNFNTYFDITLNRWILNVYAEVNNLWSTTYQNVMWYPMPGINFITGLKAKWNYKPKK